MDNGLRLVIKMNTWNELREIMDAIEENYAKTIPEVLTMSDYEKLQKFVFHFKITLGLAHWDGVKK